MRIKLTSVFVDDQEKALRFYTKVLGFVKKSDIPAGDYRWLTVVSPEEPDGTELVLEPDRNPLIDPATVNFKQAVHDAGIPFAAFLVDDVKSEYERLRKMGVKFTTAPTDMGPVTLAVLDDTCGNLIQLFKPA